MLTYIVMLVCLSMVTSTPVKTPSLSEALSGPGKAGKYATYDLLEYTVEEHKYVTPPPVFPVFKKSSLDLTGWSYQPKADDVADEF
jgi:hypothetical protein